MAEPAGDLGHVPTCPQPGAEPEQGSDWPRSLLCPAASMVPQRKGDLASVVLRALLTGICVSMLNACLAGRSLPLPAGPGGAEEGQAEG